MTDVATIARRLRQVRKAQEQFLALWALECIFEQGGKLDELHSQVNSTMTENDLMAMDRHEYSSLYRGSVLDD